MLKKFTFFIISFLMINVAFWAQTGKITGKVTDKQTGEPLIGANIVVLNTSYGASSDANGEFIIPQVPAGNYDIKASYIGFQSVTIKNIRVVTGLTEEVNFLLPSDAIATGEVVILSQRPLIEKSSTNAVRIVDAQDLQSMPIRTVNDFLSLQPGIVEQGNNIYIRGSRADETGYVLEGVSVKNIFSRDGGSLINVIPDALQELLVQAGGYTAELGNANAGIIQQNFKTGTENYHFSLRAETDNFGNYPGEKFLNTYSYGYSDYTMTFSGPVISDKIKLFLSGENYFARDYNPQFFTGSPKAYSDGSLFDTTKVYDNGIFGGKKGESQILSWQGGNIPGSLRNRFTFNGNMLIDLKPLTLKLSGAFSDVLTRYNNTDIIYMFALDRLPLIKQNNFLLNAKGTYFLNSTSFFEGDISYFDNRSKTYDPYFKDDVLAYDDSLRASQYGWVYESYTTPPSLYDFNGFPFARPGTAISTTSSGQGTGSYYNKQNWKYVSGSLAFTTRIEKHEFKVGASYQRWTLRRFSNGNFGGILSAIRLNPDLARNTDSLATLIVQNSGGLQNYGYDVFGNVTDAEPFSAKHPVFASGYIQDRIEISDLIINAGLRYDFFNMDSWYISDLSNPVYDSRTWTIPDSILKKSKAFKYLSPRLGFSFPVTDRTVFHLQYGKFVQSPGLDVAFKGITRAARVIKGGTAFNDVVAYNLEPIRTTQYEIGFTQQFSEFAAFDITAFYKDIKGQVAYNLQQTVAGSLSQPYGIYINQDFATTKGVEISLRIRRIERIRAEFNYTYSDSRGTGSGTASGFGAQQQGTSLPTVIIPLDYDQTHRGSVMFDYRFGENDGGPILQQLGFNLLFSFNSGHPYTLNKRAGLGQNSPWTGGVLSTGLFGDSRANIPLEPINSSLTPWNYNIDLRIDKTISLFDANLNIYVYVQNLLNSKNVENVYLATGNAYDDGFLSTTDAQKIIKNPSYGQKFADMYKAINLENRQHVQAANGFDLFSTPRQIRAGIMIDL